MEHIVAERLRALTRIQILHSRLDEILRLRGSLPDEVADLQDDLEGLETRLTRIESDIKGLKGEIASRKTAITEFQSKIKKYQEQQNNVKNNREHEALDKEIEYLHLEVATSEKKIRTFLDQVIQKEMGLDSTQREIEAKKQELADKQRELEVIKDETVIEEQRLLSEIQIAAATVEDRFYRGYDRIRSSMRNGLAVVTIDRNACGGCFSIIPPQTHIELKQRKRMIHCENCGRILVDQEFFDEVRGAADLQTA